MARCLRMRYRTYLNPCSGAVMGAEYPCGKCINCLHNQQDSWCIRLSETAKHCLFHEFIYDTLTFSPDGMEYRDVTKIVRDPDRIISGKSRKYLEKFSQQWLRSTGEEAYVVPDITRDIIRKWIRRGRELFVYDHGYRPKWKYWITMEYGPQTSRPHFHLLFFNISYGDYVKYLAKPWRRERGFTKTKCIKNADPKDRACVTRYISKYCSKGVFESDLVKDGLVAPPFRCISHGIGEEYIECFGKRNPNFAWFFSPSADCLSYIVVSKDYKTGDLDRNSWTRTFIATNRLDDIANVHKLCPLSEKELKALVIYRDDNGYPHQLPRYYRQKLSKFDKPSMLSYAIQALLLESAERDHNTRLARFAHSLGFNYANEEAPSLGLPESAFDMVCREYVAQQNSQSKADGQRRYIKLKNHYFRPLQNQKDYSYVC